jgi:hypothetical protein
MLWTSMCSMSDSIQSSVLVAQFAAVATRCRNYTSCDDDCSLFEARQFALIIGIAGRVPRLCATLDL